MINFIRDSLPAENSPNAKSLEINIFSLFFKSKLSKKKLIGSTLFLKEFFAKETLLGKDTRRGNKYNIKIKVYSKEYNFSLNNDLVSNAIINKGK
tara:strand:+ start:211 stop:495 length:285 start_codon:yes stop_codon:yes gene_type:complete